MAWNKPSEPKVEVKGGGGQRKVYLKGILVGAVAVVIGAVCIFAFSGKSEKPAKDTKTKPAQIKEVAPAVTNKVARTTPQTKEEKRLADLKYFRDKYGDNIPDNLKATVYFLEHPGRPIARLTGHFDYLKHSCERHIANLLTKEPGTLYIQKPKFDSRFDEDFKSAFVDKIAVLDTDTDEVKEIKQAVEDAKKELASICRSTGKMPSEIMSEQAASMYELGNFKKNLREELARVRDDPAHTDEDIKLFVEAANQMLKSKGLKEMSMPNLVHRGMRLKMREMQKAKKSATPNGDAKE